MPRKGYRAAHSVPRALPHPCCPPRVCAFISLALAPVAGSLVFSLQSLRDALDFGGSRGIAALLMAGPSVSESQRGQAARAFPHKGEEAEFI